MAKGLPGRCRWWSPGRALKRRHEFGGTGKHTK